MIWLYFLDTMQMEDPALFRDYYEQMSEHRKRKIDFYRFDKDKRLSLGAGILIGKGLAPFGYREQEMQYHTVGNGKPVFANAPQIHFNVSHAGSKVMAAFSDCCELGCDIEKVSEMDMEVARRCFCRREYERILEKETGEERMDVFFRLWTMKESFMKATGLGMELSPDGFEVSLSGDGNSWSEEPVRQEISPKQYRIKEFSLFEGYKCAVCVEDGARQDENFCLIL